MLNEVDLQVIERDAERATPGPWFDSDLNVFGPICQVTGLDTTKCRGAEHKETCRRPSDEEDDCPCGYHRDGECFPVVLSSQHHRRGQGYKDVHFAARARTHVPLLVADIRQLREWLRLALPAARRRGVASNSLYCIFCAVTWKRGDAEVHASDCFVGLARKALGEE